MSHNGEDLICTVSLQEGKKVLLLFLYNTHKNVLEKKNPVQVQIFLVNKTCRN